MKKDGDPARHFRNIFIALFLVAELLNIAVELHYFVAGDSSIGVFVVNLAIITVVTFGIILVAYMLTRKIVSQLQKSEERWQKLFNVTGEGMFVLDKDLTIIQ